jgi:hypothetical protein
MHWALLITRFQGTIREQRLRRPDRISEMMGLSGRRGEKLIPQTFQDPGKARWLHDSIGTDYQHREYNRSYRYISPGVHHVHTP